MVGKSRLEYFVWLARGRNRTVVKAELYWDSDGITIAQTEEF